MILPRVTSHSVVTQNIAYVHARRRGEIKSLKTKFQRLNSQLSGGIEFNTIMTIAALSGAGKSTLSKVIRDSIDDLNKSVKIKQIIFNLEMVAHQQAARSVVSKLKIPLRKLYSIDEPLTDEEWNKLVDYYNELASRDIDFVEVAGSAAEIAETIYHTWKQYCEGTNTVLVYEFDHALLTKGNARQSEKERVDELMYELNGVKKRIAAEGGSSVGIVLCQMNREIRSVERRMQPELHTPDTSCMFGASSIEQCSDYILFVHLPAKLQIQSYTTAQLPTRVKMPDGEIYMIPYFHLVKNRTGTPDLTFPLVNLLHFFDFDEMDKTVFAHLHKEFLEANCQGVPVINQTPTLF